ncbi:MAG TPA: SprB repeat-containing protein, partial [Cyclobacteriaceae bacterium]|nr:SprB repeat-containing protein [Cyclobacteriaceae bacterium]
MTQPTCGLQNGSVISQVSGGTQPYSYVWAPDSSKYASIIGLKAGDYTLNVVDAKGCSLSLATTLTDIPSPVPTIASVQDISCYGKNDGSISLIIDKGTQPFKINWSPYGGDSTSAVNLVGGTYTATIVDSLGCEASVLAKINEPAPLDLNLISSSDVLCYNDHNGKATVLAAGGTPNYFYYWLPINASSPVKNDLASGTYTVSVTDEHNCKASVSLFIDQPSLLTSAIDHVKNNTCFNDSTGSISVSATGGSVP